MRPLPYSKGVHLSWPVRGRTGQDAPSMLAGTKRGGRGEEFACTTSGPQAQRQGYASRSPPGLTSSPYEDAAQAGSAEGGERGDGGHMAAMMKLPDTPGPATEGRARRRVPGLPELGWGPVRQQGQLP